MPRIKIQKVSLKEVIQHAKEIGCFSCLEIYVPQNIKKWTADIPACPFCEQLCVIPKNANDTSVAFYKRLKRLQTERLLRAENGTAENR